MATINISVSTFGDRQEIDDAIEVLNVVKRIALRNEIALQEQLSKLHQDYPGSKVGIMPCNKVEPVTQTSAEQPAPAEQPTPVEAVSGETLRKVAAAKAKQIGPEKVKEFIRGLGVKTIVDVAPEDAPDVLARLQALQ